MDSDLHVIAAALAVLAVGFELMAAKPKRGVKLPADRALAVTVPTAATSSANSAAVLSRSLAHGASGASLTASS